MSQNSTRPIVVGVDDTPRGALALDWAVDEAQRWNVPLHIVYAPMMPLRGPSPEMASGSHGTEADEVLGAALERVHELAPHLPVTTTSRYGAPAPFLVDASRGASGVVVGARGRGALASALLGSTSIDVAAHAHCPVTVVRQLPEVVTDRPGVVVGVDGSELSEAAVAAAFAQADARSVPLTVVHAWFLEYAAAGLQVLDLEQERQQIGEAEQAVTAEVVAGWSQKYPDVVVRRHVVNAHPVKALVDHSKGAELVVVGSRGRGGFAGLLLGSVSQGVLHHAHAPVMVVRLDGGA
jgi:nucleotide-binding universal stress UspA family protein